MYKEILCKHFFSSYYVYSQRQIRKNLAHGRKLNDDKKLTINGKSKSYIKKARLLNWLDAIRLKLIYQVKVYVHTNKTLKFK